MALRSFDIFCVYFIPPYFKLKVDPRLCVKMGIKYNTTLQDIFKNVLTFGLKSLSLKDVVGLL